MRQRLAKDKNDDNAEGRAALAAFYESRKDEPLWVGPAGLTAKADAVIGEIKRANDWGLDARDYDLSFVPDAGGAALTREELASTEAALSLAVLKYARDARGGRIGDPAKQLSSYLDRLPQIRDPKAVLEELAGSSEPDAVLRGLHPKHPQFERLRQKYLELEKGAAVAAEIVRVPPGPALAPGQKHASVPLLRKRLLGDTAASPDETLYDETLAAAVKEFQTKAGLRPDGIVGAGTRAALNDVEVPSSAKFRANMEEWRWMPDDLGAFYVWVNIPEFALRVVKDGKVIHEERVITGLTDKQTPVFSDEMELVTFHPRWNVPNSIKVRELYPSLARGGTYFSRQNLRLTRNGRVVDPTTIDWSTTDIRNYDVYQPPGGGNVLGLVKFSFPNKHDVYMHDTPTKGLFEEASRPFSHGCMRVRNPARLAELVLGEDKGWGPEKIAELIGAPPEENEVRLDHKIPVHITYFTAWVDDDGTARTMKDVYGHEKRITQALDGKWSEIVRGPDHLAPVTYGETRYMASKNNTLEVFMSNFFGGF